MLRRKVLESSQRQTGELRMQTAEGTAFWSQIESLKIGDEKAASGDNRYHRTQKNGRGNNKI